VQLPRRFVRRLGRRRSLPLSIAIPISIIERIEHRRSFRRRGHKKPAALGLNQRQRLPRPQRDALQQLETRALSAGPAQPCHQPCRRSLHRLFPFPRFACFACPFWLALVCPTRSRQRLARPYATRVTRTANFVPTTSNSVHARRTSPAANGRSFPQPHCDSTIWPGSSARRCLTRNPRTGTAISNSTGSRCTSGLNAAPDSSSGNCLVGTSACPGAGLAGAAAGCAPRGGPPGAGGSCCALAMCGISGRKVSRVDAARLEEIKCASRSNSAGFRRARKNCHAATLKMRQFPAKSSPHGNRMPSFEGTNYV
jgi:hypothetical protein